LKSYRRKNPYERANLSGVDLAEEDLILIGVGVTVVGVVGYLLVTKILEALPSGAEVAAALNSTMGGSTNNGNDVPPGEDPNEPENQVGYE
jgi:hypothetical protein